MFSCSKSLSLLWASAEKPRSKTSTKWWFVSRFEKNVSTHFKIFPLKGWQNIFKTTNRCSHVEATGVFKATSQATFGTLPATLQSPRCSSWPVMVELLQISGNRWSKTMLKLAKTTYLFLEIWLWTSLRMNMERTEKMGGLMFTGQHHESFLRHFTLESCQWLTSNHLGLTVSKCM